MWNAIEAVLQKISNRLHGHNLEWALALHRRGEVRRDGLKAVVVRNRMEIEWRARQIHPWDQDRPPEVRKALFVRQALCDTEAAIDRIFSSMPYLDEIRLRIVDPDSNAEIVAGEVSRTDCVEARGHSSVGMRLHASGVRFHSTGYSLEPLDLWPPRVEEITRRTGPELVSVYRAKDRHFNR